MKANIHFNEIKIFSAKENDWDSICLLLKRANLHTYLAGGDNYKDYYVCKRKNELISCFSLSRFENFGFIGLFAVDPMYQKQGIGQQVANAIPSIAKELNMTKLFLSSWEAIEFWHKTPFKEIKFYEITDLFYLWCYYQIIDTDKENAHKRKFFILTIE